MKKILSFITLVFSWSAFVNADYLPDISTNTIRTEFVTWIFNGVDDYIFHLKRHCYCEYSGEEFAINVRDHKIVGITHTTSEEDLPENKWSLFPTIDELHFRIINLSDIVYEVAVEYDENWHFPVNTFIDEDPLISETDEIEYEITRFLAILDPNKPESYPPIELR